MSWMQNLCDTYDACANTVGISGDAQTTMLLPLGHLFTELNVIVYLNSDGTFQRAEKLKSSAKNKTLICVPCTDESEARSGTKAIDFPHPLFDQIKYLLTQKYLDNLKQWMAYLASDQKYFLAYQAISAVYHYIVKGTISDDLRSFQITVKDNMFMGFCVSIDQSLEDKLWRMPELWKAWLDFYLNEDITKRQTKDICYITGLDNSTYTEKHPKSINRSSGNAKLITGNDSSNFTFRGRFEEPAQAVTVSYEASQKAHQALRWLISKPSSYRCDSQAIVAWAIDSLPDVPAFYEDSYDIYNALVQTGEEKRILVENAICVDYAYALKKVLSGYGASSKLRTHKRRIAIMSTDSSTKGRLSVTYYRELSENEYEERIDQWHNTCKWYQPFGKNADGVWPGYFIGAPAVDRVVLAVLGKRRSQTDTTYDKLVKNLREQLIHCIFDGERIPLSMVIAALNRASNPMALENAGVKSNRDRWRDWEYVLGAACALIKRYYYDHKEEFTVELETGRCDRDYLYGRLLAVADKIESSARYKQGKTKDDDRATNAVRYMTAFSQHPFRTWNMLLTQQLNPYIQQLNGAGWYFNLIGDIQGLFESGAFESDASLDGKYLLGFFAQRQELRKKPEKDHNEGGEDNEFNEQN